jgi:hypothetical protein
MSRWLKLVGTVAIVVGMICVGLVACSSTPTLKSIVAGPDQLNLVPPETQQLSVWAVYSDGTKANVVNKCAFGGVAANVATISGSGLVTGVGSGTGTINVSYSQGKVSSNATVALKVTQPVLVSLSTPFEVEVAMGDTRDMIVWAVYSDGSTSNVTSKATLMPFDTTVATVNNQSVEDGIGVATVTGVGMGTTSGVSNILATYAEGGVTITSKIPVEVQGPVLTSLVGPGKLNVAIKGTQQLVITAVYSDGSTKDVTAVAACSKNSYDTAIATVDAKGVVTGVGPGTTAGVTSIFVSYVQGGITKTVTVPLLVK